MLKEHWAHAPAMAIQIAPGDPSRSSDAKLTA